MSFAINVLMTENGDWMKHSPNTILVNKDVPFEQIPEHALKVYGIRLKRDSLKLIKSPKNRLLPNLYLYDREEERQQYDKRGHAQRPTPRISDLDYEDNIIIRKIIGPRYDAIVESLRSEAARANANCPFWIFVPKNVDGDVPLYISRKMHISPKRIHNLKLFSTAPLEYVDIYSFDLDYKRIYKNDSNQGPRVVGEYRFQEDDDSYDGMMGAISHENFSGSDQDDVLINKELMRIAKEKADSERLFDDGSEENEKNGKNIPQLMIHQINSQDMRATGFPKIIHQTWKNETVPETWKESPELWKKHHPGYQYRLWTDADNRKFIEERFPWFLETYDGFRHNIQRADAVRYFILYAYGGIYSDLDIEPTRSLDSVLQQYYDQGAKIVLMNSENTLLESLCASNCFMVSVPKHPFWLLMVDSIMKNKNSRTWMGKHAHVMASTGPGRLKKVLKEYTKKNYGSDEKSRDVLLTDRQMFSPCSVCDKKPCKCRMCYLKFTKGESWTGSDSTVVNFFMCKFRDPYVAIGTIISVVVLVMLIIMLAIIFSRHTPQKTKN